MPQPRPPPETLGHSQASLSQSLVGSLLLSPGSWCTQGSVCALQESVVVALWWVNDDLLQEAYAMPRPAAPRPHPSGSPLPTCVSTGDTHSNAGLAQSLWGAQGFVRALQASLVGMAFDSKHDLCLLPSCWGFSFVLGHGVSFFGGIQHSHDKCFYQWVVIWEFLQEKMSACPSNEILVLSFY